MDSPPETSTAPNPRVGIVVAMASNGIIGRDGTLPWHLPDELRRFKRLTVGHVLVMGRKTFESIGRPLPRRRNIVLSRRPGYDADGIEVAADLESAFALASEAERIFVIGGSSVYAEALPRAGHLHLTHVHAEIDGDVRFPSIEWSDWRTVEESQHPADERHAHAFTIAHYVRATGKTSGKTSENTAAGVVCENGENAA